MPAAHPRLEGERKQVTVLFCDIVRSAALVQSLGPERFHSLMDRFFSLSLEAIHRFEGTVNQFLGDGFMALFGAPVAHEDHTQRAVLAAIALRESIAQMLGHEGVDMRIGIGTGLVVVGRIGDDLRMDYTAFGDTTVLAARLRAAAQPGEILLSEEAAERVSGYIQLARVPPVTVKERLVEARRVLGVGARRLRLDLGTRVLAPFVGRAPEMQFLQDALTRAATGRGEVVNVVGDPGVGKSRLVLEARTRLLHIRNCDGRCVSYGAAIPYLPVVDLLRQHCDITFDDESNVINRKLGDTLQERSVDSEASLPYLLHLLGQREGSESLRSLDPATIKGRTFEILRQLWIEASDSAPLVLVIEDLHWIDRTSEEFLTSLVDAIASAPILLIVTYRRGYAPPWATTLHASCLEVSPLSQAASREVVLATLARAIDRTVADAIVTRGDGNPFFLEELARATLLHGGEIDRDIPKTVYEVLAARIDGLEDMPKHAIQTAAVLGREFPSELLKAVWTRPSGIDVHVDQLKRLDFIFELGDAGRTSLSFKHALTQEVAYQSLLETHRRELHGRAGQALEQMYANHLDDRCELLAYHYARSENRGKAADYLILANRKAAGRNAMQEAIDYFYEALGVLESLPDDHENRCRRLRLLFDQTGEFHFLHRHKEYHELILRHQSLALEVGERELLGAFYARLGHRQWTAGHFVESISTLDRAVQLCESCGNDTDAAAAYAILAWAHLMLGQYAKVPSYRDKALEKLRSNFHPVWYSFARAAAALGYIWSGRWDDALGECAQAVAEGRSRSDSAIIAFHEFWISYAYIQRRQWEHAREHAEIALAVAPTRYFQGFPQAALARLMCETADAPRGVQILGFVESMLEASGHLSAWALAPMLLGAGCMTAGDHRTAAAMLRKVNSAATEFKLSFFDVQSSRLLAEIAIAGGALDEASMWLEKAIAEARRSGAEYELALALADSGGLRMPAGDVGSADDCHHEALTILNRIGTREDVEAVRAGWCRLEQPTSGSPLDAC